MKNLPNFRGGGGGAGVSERDLNQLLSQHAPCPTPCSPLRAVFWDGLVVPSQR